jgi:hypothetical protein
MSEKAGKGSKGSKSRVPENLQDGKGRKVSKNLSGSGTVDDKVKGCGDKGLSGKSSKFLMTEKELKGGQLGTGNSTANVVEKTPLVKQTSAESTGRFSFASLANTNQKVDVILC